MGEGIAQDELSCLFGWLLNGGQEICDRIVEYPRLF